MPAPSLGLYIQARLVVAPDSRALERAIADIEAGARDVRLNGRRLGDEGAMAIANVLRGRFTFSCWPFVYSALGTCRALQFCDEP